MALVYCTDGNSLQEVVDNGQLVLMPDAIPAQIGAIAAIRYEPGMIVVINGAVGACKKDLFQEIKKVADDDLDTSVYIIGNPKSADDENAIQKFSLQLEQLTGLKAIYIKVLDSESYDEGIIKVYRESDFRPYLCMGLYGLTALDYSVEEELLIMAHYGLDEPFELDRKVAFSVSGYEAAGGNIAPEQVIVSSEMQLSSIRGCCSSKRILIVGEQIYSNALRIILKHVIRNRTIIVADFFKMIPSLMRTNDVHLESAADFISLVADMDPMLIIADPVLKELVPDYKGLWVERPHYALSGGQSYYKSLIA